MRGGPTSSPTPEQGLVMPKPLISFWEGLIRPPPPRGSGQSRGQAPAQKFCGGGEGCGETETETETG